MRLLSLLLISVGCYAQTLTIVSASVSGDGRSFTIGMSSGSLSPSSGITGCFTLHGASSTGAAAPTPGSASTSGSNVTFTATVPFEASDTITIDIATQAGGCGLNSSGNFPQGQTGFSVTNNSEWNGCGNSPMSSHTRYEGSPKLNVDLYGNGYQHECIWNSAGAGISVHGTGSQIQLWAYDGFSTQVTGWNITQDGTFIGSIVNGAGSGNFVSFSLGSGFTGTHLYRIIPSNASAAWQIYVVAMVRFVGGAPTGTTPSGTLNVVSVAGDSNANFTGGGSAPPDLTGYDWFLAATNAGGTTQGWSESGTCLTNTCPGAGGGIGAGTASHLSLLGGQLSSIVIHEAAAEDAVTGATIGTCTISPPNCTTTNTFTGDLESAIVTTAAADLASGGVSLVRELLPITTTAVSLAQANMYRAAQLAVVNYVNANGGHACLYHTVGWVNPTSQGAYPADFIDGIHMNNAPGFGAGFLHAAGAVANLEAPIFYSYLGGTSSFTITGPSSVAVGTPATFTITLAGSIGAVFVSSPTQTISINDGGAGGAFSSSFGSGTGSVVFTPTSGTSFTFTYTAASGSSTVTLTPSNAQDCWINPSPLSVTVTGGSGAGQSVSFGPSYISNSSVANTPTNRAEFCFDTWNTTSVTHLFSSGAAGWVTYLTYAAPNLFLSMYNSWSSPPMAQAFNITKISTSFLCARLQHDATNMVDEYEVWDPFGNVLYSNSVPFTSSISSGTGAQMGAGGESTVNSSYARIFSTLVPMGSRPPVTADTGNVLEWKFDGTLNDSSGNGYTGTYSSGSPTYSATPYLNVVVPIIRANNATTLIALPSQRAGYPIQLDCTQSYSQNPTSANVSCFWQAFNGPSPLTFDSHTSTTPTLTNSVFGDYVIQLQVTDAAGIKALTSSHMGVVGTDANGVIINSNPAIDAIFGYQIAWGKNPWGYADWWANHAMTLRYSDYALAFWSALGWEKIGTGTISYWFGGTGAAPGNSLLVAHLTSAITNTSTTIPIDDISKLDMSDLPTRILIAPYIGGYTTEEVRICGCTSSCPSSGPATLSVCYDGRGQSPLPWGIGTNIGQFKISGTSTLFASDPTAPICPLGVPNGLPGLSLANTGTVTLTAGSPTITTTGQFPGTYGVNIVSGEGVGFGFSSTVNSFLRVNATGPSGSFWFVAQLLTGGAKVDVNANIPQLNSSGGIIPGTVHPYYLGQNYTPGAVTVVVTDPNPSASGAVITPNVVGGQITSYTVTSSGTGYTNPSFGIFPSTVLLNRPYPATATSGTYSTYAMIPGNRTMVLRSAQSFDPSATMEAMWNTTACESEISAYGNPNALPTDAGTYGQSYAGAHDVPGLDGTHQVGYTYSVTDVTGFANSSGGINFYGEDLASWAMYYRSGLQLALNAAQILSSYWMKSPWGNRTVNGFGPLVVGGAALAGISSAVLGNGAQWSDARAYFFSGEYEVTHFYNGGSINCQYDDSRGMGYNFAWLALGAIYDPDTTSGPTCTTGCRARWQADITQMLAVDNACKGSDGSWSNSAYYWGSTDPLNNSSPWAFGPLTMTHGSTAVSGTGLPANTAGGRPSCTGVSTISGASVVNNSGFLTVTGTQPPASVDQSGVSGPQYTITLTGTKGGQPFTQQYAYSGSSSPYTLSALWPGDTGPITSGMVTSVFNGISAGGSFDNAQLTIATNTSDLADLQNNYSCIYNNSTSITLDHPWNGCTSGSAGCVAPFYGYTANIAGFGQQPLMQGINNIHLGYLANFPTYASVYTPLWNASSNWMRTTAYDPPTLTTNYARVFQQCEPTTVPDGSNFDIRSAQCTWGGSLNAKLTGREQNAETANAISSFYILNPTAPNKIFGDQLFGAVWGTRANNTGGVYWDSASDAMNVEATNLADKYIHGGKWYGFFCGVGPCYRWPADRLGGPLPVITKNFTASFYLPGVSGATKVKLTITAPNGQTVTVTCTVSPCAFTADARQGSVLMQIDYWSNTRQLSVGYPVSIKTQ